MTLRELDSVKGTSACIRHTCVLATEMARLMGPVDEEANEVAVEITVESLSKESVAMVERYSAAGVQSGHRAIWPPVPSSADAAFLRGEDLSAFFSLTWEASPHGWAAVVRWCGEVDGRMALQEQLVLGSWPDGEDVTEQPNREFLAAPLALEAAAAAGCKGGGVRSF